MMRMLVDKGGGSRDNVARQMVGKNTEVAWAELKEGILRSAVEVCRESRVRSGHAELCGEARMQEAVRAK